MRLKDLLQPLSLLNVTGSTEVDVVTLCHDSRQVVPGTAFFALRGGVADGHNFIAQAVAAGATVVFAEEERALPAGVTGVLVADTRRALALVAARWFGDPGRQGAVVGITGTNGKTTTTYLLEAILVAAGRRPAVFGTVSYRFGDKILAAAHTTPDALELLATAATFVAAGADTTIMEVSSHALDQFRIDGIRFAAGIFTNLTPEHLDYHGDMERYFASKRRFFVEILPAVGGRAVISVDDSYGRRLANELPLAVTFGLAADAQVRPLEVAVTLEGIHGTILTPQGVLTLHSPLLGRFNLQNLLGAIAAAQVLDLTLEQIAQGLARAPQVPGRLERVENERGAQILVDYAHTGDALDKVLTTVAALQPQRILTVFGCGGDRDRRKRPVMGEICARMSHLAIVTSDNPRTEDPQAIIAEICQGVARVHARAWSETEALRGVGRGYVVVPDRRAAIALAVTALRPGDVLLVAGKGHEDYQIIGREKFHFDDREELRLALSRSSR
ncbi:MAG: UDP-N-acetylmuramoyl-L-alanyl-D-glutamate--2,6-diaminopimelate ligase [Desulfuromonadales bacterium GWD2_61_12]|nr:MAG: UDP-N-acetylmuramoyl-L-alanyl-D-glutamate--2,6-diaminopimelate ligase [Desulfuromonadales bacterium GWC2_61_20]OGR32784.1 MAG: UDP-N-acetylmuramoyl-L-alanyl-D-glutamate--2,6-diaminopimelate ligase [Desulfuromonadales bacterium GWD2_61_12]HAD04755.1 UDP-N-acetylmuramoyl-L-alanyl-D-glutamate--2,6-diaminopimelate ligase [Desulfuromonas sp.]HBT82740.1 UDP-N-acetylmuramoyl-L-alanyl-D-glutamate--2,6-diaminopimelate ligase [Desulfuromonas sp.]